MTKRTWTVGSAAVAGLVAALLTFSSAFGQSGTPGFCQICGDGFCAPSCENAQTCPADCAPVEQ